MKSNGVKRSLLERFDEILSDFMLGERDIETSCYHQWEKRRLDCGIEGFYCSRCNRKTLP